MEVVYRFYSFFPENVCLEDFQEKNTDATLFTQYQLCKAAYKLKNSKSKM